jgi:hypothetical protein
LLRFQDPPVEDEFVARVAKVVQSVCGGLPELASRERIRRICTYLKNPTYGERWWQIQLKLRDLPLDYDRPPEMLVSYMKKLFVVYCTTGQYILRHTKLWAPRKTLLSYSYVFRQCLRLLDGWFPPETPEVPSFYTLYAKRFTILKTRDKIALSDERWKHLCEEVNKRREWVLGDEPETGATPLEHRKWKYMPLLQPNLVFIL